MSWGWGRCTNRLSCIACHVKNGRGAAPGDEGGVARAMVLRLSKPGADAHNGPAPHPVYGAQLNPEGVPGVPGEGRAVIHYEFFDSKLADGTAVAMRRPRLALEDLAYGPMEAETPTSPRNAPPVFGLGLLEAVPESQILALAAKNGGRANYVFDIESGAIKLGRFGLKANQPSLKQQIANAFAEDIGISSSLFPGENCTPAEAACLEAAKGAPRRNWRRRNSPRCWTISARWLRRPGATRTTRTRSGARRCSRRSAARRATTRP